MLAPETDIPPASQSSDANTIDSYNVSMKAISRTFIPIRGVGVSPYQPLVRKAQAFKRTSGPNRIISCKGQISTQVCLFYKVMTNVRSMM